MESTPLKTKAAPPLARPHPRADEPKSDHGQGDGGNGHVHSQPPPGLLGSQADAPAPDHDQVDLNVSHPPTKWIVTVGVVAVVVMAILLAVGIVPRFFTHKDLAADAEAALHRPIPVTIVTPRKSNPITKVLLPGTLRPWQEVSIYARSSGYLKGFYADISNQVIAGTLLADISSPDIDRQLETAQANLVLQKAAAEKARTDMVYAKTTDERYEKLRGSNGVTQQELDQFKAQYDSAVAIYNQAVAQIGVAEANVQQLTQSQKFEKIYAPFTGVVTGRAYDVGAFIIANPTAADIVPMFKLAKNDVLKAFVNVPQSVALQVTKGMTVNVTAREKPGRIYQGIVLGTTNYLDPSARTLLTEIRIENTDLSLLPQMFIDASFEIVRDHPPLIMPSPALIVTADGNQVAVVKDNKAHFQKVTLGIDYGNEIEILSGLNGDEQIIGNPGEKIVEGAEVKPSGDSAKPTAPVTAPSGK